jgi:hypothetical protein
MISLEEHLKYLKINKTDNTYVRTLKVSVHSFSFYIYALTIIAFFLELHPKIKLFLIILLIINALLGALVAHKRINRIKKVLLIKDKNRVLFHEKMFHITIVITMILFFTLPKVNKMDILFSSLACFILLHIYNTIFDARIIYMDVLPKNKAIFIYTSLFFLLYSGVYFYTNN